MENQNLKNSVILFFFILLLFVPIFWFSNPNLVPERSLIEGRTLKVFPSLSYRKFKTSVKRILQGKPKEAKELFFDQFLNGTYQTNLAKASSDQFPIRIFAIHAAKALDRSVISLAYSFLLDNQIPANMNSGLYIMRDRSLLISRVSRYSNTSAKTIDSRIENYEILLKKFPEINFFLFYHERLSNSPYHPLIPYYWNADQRQAFKYFEKNKPQDLFMSSFLLTEFADHGRYYFHTDHHWNIHGALRAYDSIYKLLEIKYPDISPPLQHDHFITFPGIEFLGSLARASFYPINPDIFEVADINLPDYEIDIVGKNEIYNDSIEYLNGNYSVKPYVNHYGNYYGEQQKLLEYKFNVSTERNLLIIGSSFTRSLQPLIASHYHLTYVVDLRQFEDFSLGEFISQFPVDDVLIIGDNTVAFQDKDWAIKP